MKKQNKSDKRVREVRISVALPASVTALVSESEDGDLTIESLVRIDCEASARGVTEHMRDEDFDGLRQAFDKAQNKS